MKMFKTRTFEDFPYTHDQIRVVAMRKPANIYLRFGHFQSDTGERSLNWATGEYETGISVYPAILQDDCVIPSLEWLSDIKSFWDQFRERTQYALSGREVGKGSDGEPVLAPSSIVIRGIKHPRLLYGLEIVIPEMIK